MLTGAYGAMIYRTECNTAFNLMYLSLQSYNHPLITSSKISLASPQNCNNL